MAVRFHKGLAQMVRELAVTIRKKTGLSQVALSGGVWQNTTLLALVLSLLRQENFETLVHTRVPCNDGGLALGQAVIAARRLSSAIQ
jgi:hydrogenase maturation protein HypF